ncbi:hypothetical protein [Spirosoma jeollabukense]
MTEPVTRIKAILDALNTTPNAFALAYGLNVPTMYAFANGSRNPGYDTLVSICTVEPRISAEYLLRGEGEPLRDKQLSTALTTVEQLKELKQEIIQSLDMRIQQLGG